MPLKHAPLHFPVILPRTSFCICLSSLPHALLSCSLSGDPPLPAFSPGYGNVTSWLEVMENVHKPNTAPGFLFFLCYNCLQHRLLDCADMTPLPLMPASAAADVLASFCEVTPGTASFLRENKSPNCSLLENRLWRQPYFSYATYTVTLGIFL